MNERTIKAVVLSVALGWATQGVAQDAASSESATHMTTKEGATQGVAQDAASYAISFSPAISLVGSPIRMQPATLLDKFIWAGVALINPGNEYAPVPLYGYQVKDLLELDRDMYKKALIEAGKGNVHIAIAVAKKDSSGENTYYNLQGLLVKPEVEKSFRGEWDEFLKKSIKGNEFIAFTRTLKLGDENGVKKKIEFIATPNLWMVKPDTF